jgi:hypothetical protein
MKEEVHEFSTAFTGACTWLEFNPQILLFLDFSTGCKSTLKCYAARKISVYMLVGRAARTLAGIKPAR